MATGPPPPPLPDVPPPPEDLPPARPAWRTVTQRSARRPRKRQEVPPPPEPIPEPRQAHSWVKRLQRAFSCVWDPSSPPPPPHGVPPPPPARPVWRPVTQRAHRLRKRQDASQLDPALAPTPPPVEPTLFVPDRGSPGLFGPRTPRDSYSA